MAWRVRCLASSRSHSATKTARAGCRTGLQESGCGRTVGEAIPGLCTVATPGASHAQPLSAQVSESGPQEPCGAMKQMDETLTDPSTLRVAAQVIAPLRKRRLSGELYERDPKVEALSPNWRCCRATS